MMKLVKRAFRKRIDAQVEIAQAKVEAMKAKADAASARAALAAMVALLNEKAAIAQKADELREAGHATYQQLKADIESRIAQLEQSVQAIASTFKAA